ncbi:FAD:protein FMN transferase [Gottschalkiaceae bacterium SANA]|nr:FAD:protein FMN transferase [Gottschalkiaceae bacterium SANA]
MRIKRSIQVLGIVLVTAIALVGCAQKESPQVVETPSKASYIEDHAFQLDTIITVKLYGEEDTSLIEDSFSRIEELEKMLSVHLEGSDLAKIRDAAGISAVKVQAETFEVMEAALGYAELSQGRFDPTAGPLIDLWGIDPPEGHLATEEELADIKPLIDYQKLIVDGEAGTIYLQDEKMIANLGAIAKGYIADEVKEQLVDAGVTSGIINLGGNVLLIGGKPDGSDFRIGVQDPDSLRGEYLGIVSLKDESIVTSGDYERFFEVNGKKYHHILDPFTGFPAQNSLRSVTIISPKSTDGDALSTTCFLLGLDEGIKLIRSLPSIDAIFVTKDDRMIFSSQDLLDRYQSTNEAMEEEVYAQ